MRNRSPTRRYNKATLSSTCKNPNVYAASRGDTRIHSLSTVNTIFEHKSDPISARTITIHPCSFVYPHQGCRTAGASSSCHRTRGGAHPGQVVSQSQANIQRQTPIRTHIHGQFRIIKACYLTNCMPFYCGKPE